MMGLPLRHIVTHPTDFLSDFVQNPLEVCTTFRERLIYYREGKKPQCLYEAIPDWEERLHADLRLHWPCEFVAEFYELWPQVIGELEGLGIKAGPMTYLNWNDGDT